jgi:hypothetical protein
VANQQKVIHVSPAFHEKLKKFCQRRDIKMQEFAEEAIGLGMEALRSVEKGKRRT